MPLFQRKTAAAPERHRTPTKDGPVASRPDSAPGSRRSLSKALAEVMNSRKGDRSSPQKFRAPAVRSSLARRNVEDTGDSSTAVESSSSGAKQRPAGRVRPTLNVESSPLKQSTQLPQVPPSPTSTVAAKVVRDQKTDNRDPSPASPTVSKLPRGLVPSPKSETSPDAVKPHPNFIRSSSPARNGSASPRANNTPSPTIGRRVKPLPTASGARRNFSASVPKSSEKAKQSGLRQPKARPTSAIFLSSVPLPPGSGRQPLTEQNLLANERAAQSPEEPPEARNVTSARQEDVSPPRNSDTERECSLTPSRNKPGRPVSPLPRRADHDSSVLARRLSRSLEVSNASSGVESHSKENQNVNGSTKATQARTIPGKGMALPRPSGAGSVRGRHSVAVGDARLLRVRGAASSHAPSDSSDRHLVAKRRRSEITIRHPPSSQSQQLHRPPARLNIPRHHAPQQTSTGTTPSTPTTSSRSAIHSRADHTFSVLKKHVVSTPLADMTFSEIPEDDDDDAAASTSAFSFHFPSSVSSRHSTQDDADDDEPAPKDHPASTVTPAASQLAIPTRMNQQHQKSITTSTPSRSLKVAARKRLPTLRVNKLSPDGPRHSFMPLETSFDRSLEKSQGDEGNVLSNIPAPFETSSVVRGSTSVASISVMSEGSLILNESEGGILHSPSAATNFSSPSGDRSGIARTGPTTISRLLFNAPPNRSGATSPANLPASASGPVSPQSVAGPDLMRQVRAASMEAELAELRTQFEGRETVILTQQSRISSLESELSTLYTVTRARDAANSTFQAQLKQQLAGCYFISARREWEAVRDSAEAEAEVVAAERHMLQTVFSSFKSSLRL